MVRQNDLSAKILVFGKPKKTIPFSQKQENFYFLNFDISGSIKFNIL